MSLTRATQSDSSPMAQRQEHSCGEKNPEAVRILMVGTAAGTGIGGSFHRAAIQAGYQARLLDTAVAHSRNRWLERLSYHFCSRRPFFWKRYADAAVRTALEQRPQLMLVTGRAPLPRNHLLRIRAGGVQVANFLTDDPWNSGARAPWFERTLADYDHIFVPRRAAIPDLERAGCRRVHYLRFGYDPKFFSPVEVETPHADPGWDVLFAGGADSDRFPWMIALIRAGLRPKLFGEYWDRNPITRPYAHGLCPPEKLAALMRRSPLNLILTRRANRDDHSMRTFEVPAAGGCGLAEWTDEHERLYGADGESVKFFRTEREMVDGARWLMANPAVRSRLARVAFERIRVGNTYADRLDEIIRSTALMSRENTAGAT